MPIPPPGEPSVTNIQIGAGAGEPAWSIPTQLGRGAGEWGLATPIEIGRLSSESGQSSPFQLVSVDFVANVTAGEEPLTVNFTHINTGPYPYDTFLWEFGDGEVSTDETPIHEYETFGVYTVTLTATRYNHFGLGLDAIATQTKVDYIVVFEAPKADFVANPESGSAPLTVSFANTSNFVATEFLWDFGDPASGASNISTSANPVHEYETPGSYTVTLTASNGIIGSRTVTKVDVITVGYPVPVAGFLASPISGYEPLTVQFTDTSTGFPTGWSWDFGDGSTSTSQNSEHIFTEPGTYTVILTVSNPTGSATAQTTIEVLPIPDLVADFYVESMLPGGGDDVVVAFKDASKEAITYNWDFGDPDSVFNTSIEQDPTHTYSEPGTYEITLTVWHGPFSDTICKNILVTLDVLRYQEIWGTARFANGVPVDPDRVVSVGKEITAIEFECGSGATDPFHSYKTVADIDSHTGDPVTRFLVRGRGHVIGIPESGFEDGDPVFIFIGGRMATDDQGDPVSIPFFQTLPSNPQSHVELELIFPLASSSAMPAGGTFDDHTSVTLTTNIVPANIWYTIDGSDPRYSPTRQQFVDPILMTEGTTVLKFYTVDPLGPDEPVREETYIVNGPLVRTDIPPGEYSEPQEVTLIGNRPGIIYYQLNGTGPYSKFTAPIAINPGQTGIQVTVIKTYLIDTRGKVGETQTFEYKVDLYNPTIQSFTINNGDLVTATQLVTVQIEASSFTNTVAGLLLSTLPDFSDATVQLYQPEVTFMLPAPDGPKTLYVQVFDQFDPPRASTVHATSIELDTEIPVLTVSAAPTVPIGSATYTFTGTKSANSGILTKQNGGSEVLIIPVGPGTTWEHAVTLVEGINTIEFEAVTTTDNRSGKVTRTITVYFVPHGVTEATTITNASGLWRVPFVFFNEQTGDLDERQHNFKITITADSGPDPIILFPVAGQVINESIITVSGTAQPGSIITLRVEPS